MQTEIKCSKCEGIMLQGFILDRSYGGKYQQTWVEGQPEKSVWTVLKTSGRTTFNVQVFRCVVCSYLEFYTTEEVDVK